MPVGNFSRIASFLFLIDFPSLPVSSPEYTRKLLQAFAYVAKKRLMTREKITLPGIGLFSIRHIPSQVAESEDGQRVLFPPRDEVVFIQTEES